MHERRMGCTQGKPDVATITSSPAKISSLKSAKTSSDLCVYREDRDHETRMSPTIKTYTLYQKSPFMIMKKNGVELGIYLPKNWRLRVWEGHYLFRLRYSMVNIFVTHFESEQIVKELKKYYPNDIGVKQLMAFMEGHLRTCGGFYMS